MCYTHAHAFAKIRQWHGEVLPDTCLSRELERMLDRHLPIYVPDTCTGDQGEILFADGSILKWDWDNGTLHCPDWGEELAYPYGADDPLFARKAVCPMTDAQYLAYERLCERHGKLGEAHLELAGHGTWIVPMLNADGEPMMWIGIEPDGYTHS